ncbi:MAG TPA: ABC transporter substrate-binding protein [Desulfovibrio sp.]|jgi:branched-chain amino acid transport system substrate-binding protein|uniref:ABC transporter substrate-binding protein n=1 Tax=Desulfovibrio TaxID=872 RepID=UPI0004094BC1|nr:MULTISPECIES: ABC transporter substrate-binding protein [Desulfovibrio]MDY0306865.1 ABC transporter substrate-binding protein [Desulfovibrionaceae bacterium]HMM39156.1 ABC transporter substrate-binding protein [Desulfovibrio sp.]
MKRLLVLLTLAAMVLGVSAAASAAEPIKIGALYGLTGGMSSIDTPSLNGAKLKAKLINKSGGLLGGRQVEILGVDTKTDQKASAMGAKKVLSEGIVAGIGYSDPAFVLPAAPLFQKQGIPFVTSGATLPTLPKMIGDCMFMTPFGDDDQSYAIADYTVKKLGAKKVAVWTDNSMDFTKTLSRFYKERIKKLGGTIVLEDFFMMGDKDFSAQIARLKSSGAEAVFVSSIPNEAGLTVKQIREAGLKLPIVSGDGFDTELITTVPGPALANDVFFATHTYREDTRPEVLDFIKEYKAEYGHDPENAFAALGFDAVGLIADAITRAGSAEPAAIKKALRTTKDFKAVTGTITYSRASGVPVKGVSVISVKGGKYKVEEVWYPEAK